MDFFYYEYYSLKFRLISELAQYESIPNDFSSSRVGAGLFLLLAYIGPAIEIFSCVFGNRRLQCEVTYAKYIFSFGIGGR